MAERARRRPGGRLVLLLALGLVGLGFQGAKASEAHFQRWAESFGKAYASEDERMER